MNNDALTIKAEQLRKLLEENKEVIVLDVRPKHQREEWKIPGSKYIDAYERLNANDPGVLDEISLPKGTQVVTVCAAGRTSQIAANELRKKGIDAYSLEGGMKAWSTAWNTAQLSFPGFEIVQVRRTGKGCLSYIIIADGEAVVVDASLPEQIYERILKEKNIRLKYVMETHIHADHLSRSKKVAELNNVPLYLPIPNNVKFHFQPIDSNGVLHLGNISIKVIHTPGHTLESISFLIDEKVLITGDTLFVNGVGRPDLKADGEEVKQKARLLFQSLQRLFALPKHVIVLPAHTNQPVEFNGKPVQSTLSAIWKNLPMLQLSEEAFVDSLTERIPPTPENFLTIVEKNLLGDFSEIDPVDLEAGANRCAIA